MKRLFFLAFVAFSAIVVSSCSGKKAESGAADDAAAAAAAAGEAITVVAAPVADEATASSAPAKLTVNVGAMDMIKDCLINRRFASDAYLKDNCTDRLLRQLADDDALCFAGKKNGKGQIRIQSVQRLEDGWYRYTGVEGKTAFTHDIRLLKTDGGYLFDELH